MSQSRVCCFGVEPLSPWVIHIYNRSLGRGQAALLALQASPVIDQLVASHAHQPGNIDFGETPLAAGSYGCQERFAGQIFSN